MALAKRATSIKPSLTLAITAKAKAMRAEGIDVIGLGAGEPDFDTPELIKQAAVTALKEGFTKYTPVAGILPLREAISEKFKRDNNLFYLPKDIIVSCGAKHSLYNAMQVLCEAGEEVILPAPYWVSYPEQIKLSGATPVIVETTEREGFKLTPEKLLRAITPKTKLLILNSPSNPTGAVYSPEELAALGKIIEEKNIYVISDEIYEKIIYDRKHQSIASLSPKLNELTIVINGVSKAYSMTGWRIGYAAGPREVISAMGRLQSHSTSNPTSIAQKAALQALQGGEGEVVKMRDEFQKRKDFLIKELNDLPEVSCFNPSGAFYAFPNISKLFWKGFGEKKKKISTSLELTEYFLEEARVAVVPGSAFGAEGYLRLSYATSMENIIEGLKRIREALAK